jgi:tungstate transport system substrate-binding protein
LVCVAATTFLAAGCGKTSVTVATTNDIESSEMYGQLVREFEKQSGMTVKTVVFDSSAAVLEAGAQGQADALLVGKVMALDELNKQGYARSTSDVFYSDFVVVGPEGDPAQIKGLDCPGKSCKKIGTAGEEFVACGNASDLDSKVMGYWVKCGIDPVGQAWFSRTGSDVAATLQVASDQQAYTICDMSTWLQNKDGLNLTKLVEGCTMLMNQYDLVVVNPDAFPGQKLNTSGADKLAEFMTGESGQQMVGAYQESGVVIYHPNATRQADEQPMNI